MKGISLRRTQLNRSLSNNPVVVKEIRTRMRGKRAFVLVTAHLFILALLLIATYLFFFSALEVNRSLENRRTFGKALFGLIVWLELMMVSFTAPALTAGAISNEHERQTFDLLQVTLLPARQLVQGKFIAGLSFLLLLILTAIPLLSPAFLVGGILPSEIAVALLILVVTAIAFSAVGIFSSTLTRRTLVSTVISYAFAIFIVIGIPMLILIALIMISSTSIGWIDRMAPLTQAVLIATGWLVLTINPLTTIIFSEIPLLSDNSLFLIKFSISGSRSVHLLSPWIGYVLIYLTASLLLLWASILRVQKLDE